MIRHARRIGELNTKSDRVGLLNTFSAPNLAGNKHEIKIYGKRIANARFTESYRYPCITFGHQAAFTRLTGQGSKPIGSVIMNDTANEPTPPKKILSPAAKRALAEAAERRKARDEAAAREPEKGGPKGVEPTRYGDWERGGIAYDF